MVETGTVPRSTSTRLWPFVVARAVPALVIGAVITFSTDHSVPLGLYSFGAFALTAGAVLAASGIRHAVPSGVRSPTILQGAVGILAGLAALVFATAGLPFFLYLVSVWAAVTGFLELYIGLRNRGRHPSARDWVFTGALTAVFAVVTLLIPVDLRDTWAGEGAEGVLTASIVSVGALGAYAAILGVYLVIAGLSLKWAVERPSASEAEGTR